MVCKTAGKTRLSEEQVTGLLDFSNLRRCQRLAFRVSLGWLLCGASAWSSLVVTPIYKDQYKEILEFQSWEGLEKLSNSSSSEAPRPKVTSPKFMLELVPGPASLNS